MQRTHSACVYEILIATELPYFIVDGEARSAGTYELVTGDHENVCEAYRRNFEPRHESEPMACERRFDPKIPGFSRANWTKLNLNDHFDLNRPGFSGELRV